MHRSAPPSPSLATILLALLACGGGGAAAESVGPLPPSTPPTTSPPPTTTPPATTPPPTTTPPPSGTTAPTSAVVTTPDKVFSPAAVTIAAGGTVTWVITDHDHDVTFTGAKPEGGDIPETEEGAQVTRTFSTPGSYTYECSEHADDGMSGTIVVVAAGTAPPPGGTTPPGGGTTPPPGGSAVTVSTPGDSFSPQSVTIAPGGTVTWSISGATHNVTFGATAPPGGNIPDTRGASVSRSFPAAGTYDYQCTRHDGMTGRVLVQ